MNKGRRTFLKILSVIALLTAVLASCNTVDDDRIPSLPVNINLSPISMWDAFGVAGIGDSRRFVPQLREPSGFAWLDRAAAGFGGVLLVRGNNPYTLEADVPLAYDLACPVERQPDVRVRMEPGEIFPVAVCPVCGSTYNVVERGGVPLSGPAFDDRYALRRYEVVPAAVGGFLIIN